MTCKYCGNIITDTYDGLWRHRGIMLYCGNATLDYDKFPLTEDAVKASPNYFNTYYLQLSPPDHLTK